MVIADNKVFLKFGLANLFDRILAINILKINQMFTEADFLSIAGDLYRVRNQGKYNAEGRA